MWVRIEQNELGPRLHILRWRCHHYHSGFALLALGAYLIAWDRRDLLDALHRASISR